jgi:hypothetical protein
MSRAYPSFDSSPYRVGERVRTERWWYSDGIWLDQASSGASVGFAWTQWLADRGVQVSDGELGGDYGQALYRAARQQVGDDPDVDGGARIDAAAEVLKSRGLVAECYSFSTFEPVLDALLERGPVVAGVIWHQSMSQPADTAGWALCRLEPESPVSGGHAVVLNGISLDLTIDGVKGFVRFKNSWGRRWGDGGHAMISIDDLRATLTVDESLLPIPAAEALRSGLRPDVATDGLPYGPSEVRFEQSAIGSDLWTRRDTVGMAAYAEAIARGIQHPETKPPLTIGIKGPWGAGKTSLMRMIRDRLEWPGLDGSSDELRAIHLTKQTAKRVAAPSKGSPPQGPEDLREVTNAAVLKKIRAGDSHEAIRQRAGSNGIPVKLRAELGAAGASTPRDENRWRPTVWFNPWMYQTGEQVWAGLAYEIITQVTERMSRGEQEHFWLHLNLKRVDEQAVRRKIYGLVLNRGVRWMISGLGVLLAGIVVLALGYVGWPGVLLTALGPATALAGIGVSAWTVLGSKASAGLSELIQPATGMGRVVGQQMATAYEEVVENPDYRTQSGLLYLVHSDIQRVLDLVATPERPLVIFVDDLDRCSPGTVVQVIEAINVFVAGAYPNSIFVIAMEPEMVAAHVEAVYGDLVQKLEQTSGTTTQAFDLGWRFLEKIVQLPLALPAMEPARTTALFESLFPSEVAPAVTPENAPSDVGDGRAVEEALEGASLSAAVGIAGDLPPDAATRDAVRRVIERRLTIEEPEVQEVILYAARFLRRNPREIKRFVNLFRFFTMIYAERRLENLPTPASLHEVAKLAVVGIRWPGLLSALAMPVGGDGERTVFEYLESPPQTSARGAAKDAALKRTLKSAGLSQATTARLMTPELKEFLTSEPKVGAGVRGYL